VTLGNAASNQIKKSDLIDVPIVLSGHFDGRIGGEGAK
jgi:hypothetical protein